MINGYVNEANGGSFWGGYIGGAISGALCGVGASAGGMLYAETAQTATLSIAVLGKMAVYSFLGGCAGNFLGTAYTSLHNSKFKGFDIDLRETFSMSVIAGSLNVLAGLASGVSSFMGEFGKTAIDLNSKLACQILAGTIAGVTEAIYDVTSYIMSKLIELL